MQHGERPEGVDWGPHPEDLELRICRVLDVMDEAQSPDQPPSILDVGCGYGSALEHLERRGWKTRFTGIDLCAPMIESARRRHPEHSWITGDIFDIEFPDRFDYVVCNGLPNLKLEASLRTVKDLAKRLVARMFALSRIGCSINFMTTNVNFFASHLFYQNPVEFLGWCMTELTTKVRLDHSYPLYEFTLCLYREDAPGRAHGSHRKQPATT